MARTDGRLLPELTKIVLKKNKLETYVDEWQREKLCVHFLHVKLNYQLDFGWIVVNCIPVSREILFYTKRKFLFLGKKLPAKLANTIIRID